jgi:hypothetical protein
MFEVSHRNGRGGAINNKEKFIKEIQTQLCKLLVELQILEKSMGNQDNASLLFLGVFNSKYGVCVVYEENMENTMEIFCSRLDPSFTPFCVGIGSSVMDRFDHSVKYKTNYARSKNTKMKNIEAICSKLSE